MKVERTISAYKNYFRDFISSLTRDEIFELRAEHGGNIFRVFFIFDDGNVVMLFNGFQKKSQKTPQSEINKAIQLKKEYYAAKR